MRIDLPRCDFKNCKYQFDGNCMDKGRYEKCEYIELALNDLPSVQPERKNGKWIKVKPIGGDTEVCMCPYCRTVDWNILADSYKFCPYCGKSVSGIFDAEGD